MKLILSIMSASLASYTIWVFMRPPATPGQQLPATSGEECLCDSITQISGESQGYAAADTDNTFDDMARVVHRLMLLSKDIATYAGGLVHEILFPLPADTASAVSDIALFDLHEKDPQHRADLGQHDPLLAAVSIFALAVVVVMGAYACYCFFCLLLAVSCSLILSPIRCLYRLHVQMRSTNCFAKDEKPQPPTPAMGEPVADSAALPPCSVGRRPKCARVESPHHKDIRVVVLTGGPCGGKSSALPILKAQLEEQGKAVYMVPEIMTLLRNGGCKMSAAVMEEFVRAAVPLQMEYEESFIRSAMSTGKPCVIILDRGIMDMSIFVPTDVWERILLDNDLSNDTLVQRYDLVLHFVTVANGKPEYYRQGETADDAGVPVIRKASPEKAVENDAKFGNAWKDHSNLRQLGVTDTFQQKVNQAMECIVAS